jgi:iron-sulfur cluster repair protein YtfE (RIC family)
MGTGTLGTQAVWAFAEHEHRDLVCGINWIHELACDIGSRRTSEFANEVPRVLRWLDSTLEPHVAWEEASLYPEIDARTGTRWATRAARFDHQQIREVAGWLRADQRLLKSQGSGDLHTESRCRLFALEALLRAHIEREERYLIPLLENGHTLDGRLMAVAHDATIS